MKSSALFRLLYLQGTDPEPTEAQTGSIPLQFLRDLTEHRGEALKFVKTASTSSQIPQSHYESNYAADSTWTKKETAHGQKAKWQEFLATRWKNGGPWRTR